MNSTRLPTLEGVYEAKRTISKYLKPTPLFYSRRLSKLLGCQPYLKLENLQPTRAFKVRGGINYMERIKQQAVNKTVITASTGNHAQSIAYAGLLFGINVKIVMPRGVPELKIAAVKELDAEVITYGSYFDEASQYTEQLAVDKGYICVHAINEPLLHEGVATMHLEIFDELPSIDVVINPIGGGSGASGACVVYKTLNPRIKVIGVQAEGAPAFYNSWKEGTIEQTDHVSTIAEGLATAKAYGLPFRILRKWIDDIVLVSDDEMTQCRENDICCHRPSCRTGRCSFNRGRIQDERPIRRKNSRIACQWRKHPTSTTRQNPHGQHTILTRPRIALI